MKQIEDGARTPRECLELNDSLGFPLLSLEG